MSTRLMELTILLLSLFGCVLSSSKPASIRDKATGQLVTSSLVSWESFNPKIDVKQQFENAIAGGHYSGADKQPVYICRSTIDAVSVTGFIIKRNNDVHACIVSQHENVRLKPEFDILVNKYNGAKVEWKTWEKTIPFTQEFFGAVSTIGTGSRSEIYYIGRHKINHTTGHTDIDHAIGWYDPKADLGKIYAIYEAKEKSFESGEILVVIEAERYELHDIKFKTTKLQENRNRTLLGQTILKNEGIEESDVNAVIEHEYEIVRNFGTHEGIARSVNTTVYMSKTETFKFIWGIQTTTKAEISKTVGTRLKPGTAVNVSLYADYVTKEGPYDGQLIIHYVDGTTSKKRRVTVSSGFEGSFDDKLETEYSETYWIHNDTIVPTTTKRTSTSTAHTTNRSVFPTTNNNEIAITEKAKSLSNQNSNSNNLVELDDEEDGDDESKNDINSATAMKIAQTAIILVIGSLLLTSF